MWTKRSVVPPWTPPLKRTIGPLALNGVCSGKATSTSPSPEPTIASGQALLRGRGGRASSWPYLQTGRPLAFTWMLLSKSSRGSLIAGGWLPSVVPISASMCAEIGAWLVPGELGRRDAAVVLEEEVPGADHLRLGEGARRDDQREPGPETVTRISCFLMLLPPASWMESSRSSPAASGSRLPNMGTCSPGIQQTGKARAITRPVRSAVSSSRREVRAGGRRGPRSARMRFVTVRRSTPSAAAVEETLRSAAK